MDVTLTLARSVFPYNKKIGGVNYNRGFFFLIFLNHSKVISSSLIRSCFCQDTKISHCTFFVQCQKLACKSISRTSPIVLYFILLSKFLSNLSLPLFMKFMQSFFYYPSCLGASTSLRLW